MFVVLKDKDYSDEQLPFRINYLEMANGYENFIGWEISSLDEYNGVFVMEDKMLVSYDKKYDVTEAGESLFL